MKIKVITAFLTVSILVSALFFSLFDQFVITVATESVKTWIHSEDTMIQEGNFLSSVTKTQKLLLASEFVKGMAVYDISKSTPRTLLEFGQRPSADMSSSRQAFDIRTTGFLKKEIFMTVPHEPDLQIVFSIYSERLRNIFWITNLAFYLLIASFAATILLLKKREQKKVQDYADRATRAAHDLAPPLVVLNSLAARFTDSSEAIKSLKFIIARITPIIDDLSLHKKKQIDTQTQRGDANLKTSLEGLIAEKNIRAGVAITVKLQIDAALDALEPKRIELLRALANLIDNSIEATEGVGEISVKISESNGTLVFAVEDRGRGIPIEVQPRLGEHRFSFGKDLGTGLGLHSAKTFAESLGGSIEVESQVGLGTTVSLKIPIEVPGPTLFLVPETEIVVLDDDPGCHVIWKNHFESIGIGNQISYFFTPDEFQRYLSAANSDMLFLFCDYDLRSTKDGLDVIESNQLQRQAALVTGMAHESDVRLRAEQLKVPLFSKSNLASIAIKIV